MGAVADFAPSQNRDELPTTNAGLAVSALQAASTKIKTARAGTLPLWLFHSSSASSTFQYASLTNFDQLSILTP